MESTAAQTEAVQPRVRQERKPGVRVLMPEYMGLSEDKRHDWIADVEPGTQVEDVLDPAFWAHTAVGMDPYDHIEVRTQDGTWIAYLIVLFAERNWARVVLDKVIRIEQNTEVPEESVKNRVEYKGAIHKFSVIRISDSQVLHDGFKTRDDASAWLRNFEKSVK